MTSQNNNLNYSIISPTNSVNTLDYLCSLVVPPLHLKLQHSLKIEPSDFYLLFFFLVKCLLIHSTIQASPLTKNVLTHFHDILVSNLPANTDIHTFFNFNLNFINLSLHIFC